MEKWYRGIPLTGLGPIYSVHGYSEFPSEPQYIEASPVKGISLKWYSFEIKSKYHQNQLISHPPFLQFPLSNISFVSHSNMISPSNHENRFQYPYIF